MKYAVINHSKHGVQVFFGRDDDHLWEQIEATYEDYEVEALRGEGEIGPFDWLFIDDWDDVPTEEAIASGNY